jgi:two-component system sensor histidine kinase SenX3
MRLLSRIKAGWLRPIFHQKPVLFGTVLVSALALGIVAFLQYRWTTQVSRASEVRIGSNLQLMMMDWHLDFYREFAAVCVVLQVGPDSGAQDGWNAYAQRYAEWRRSATNFDLVKNVYIWETSQRGQPRLFQLGADAPKIAPQNPPAELNALLDRLQARSSSLPVALHAWSLSQAAAPTADGNPSEFQAVRSDTMTGWQFDARIPAIVHPLVHHKVPFEDSSAASAGPIDWMVVVLDRAAIERKLLPMLADRYFADQHELPLEVAVTAVGETPHVLYSSNPDFVGDNPATADAAMNIFGPPPETTEGHFWQAVKRGESLRREDWHNFSGPIWFPVISYDSTDQPWMLLARRRGDPLEALVQQTERRNLAISVGVFLLLAVSMGLVMVASHRAQKLAQLQIDFVASVSHELRTPLTVICSAAENILDGVVGGKQQLTQYGSVIRNQGRQLAALVDQVLLFASTQDGRIRYQLRPISVPSVLQSVLNSTAALAERAKVTIEKDVPPDLPQVMGDLPALSQCLQNLVVNAIKYGGERRWIGIRARLDHGDDGPEVQISVQDRGIGISSHELSRIFEPFYRSPEVSTAQIHGTGLGLPLAKRIAEAMGGRLTVTSKVGVGSIFTLHLVPAPADRWPSEVGLASRESGREP